MGFATIVDNSFLDLMLGGVAYAPKATVYVGLSTTAPTKAGGNVTEPVGNAYARVAVPNNATNFPAASGGVKSNGTLITFPEATGSWGTLTYFIVYDAATGGNVLGYGALSIAMAIGINNTPNFPAGSLSFTLT